MNCRELTASVTAYLDGELDDAEASACRGHLRTCPACRTLAADEAAVRDGLADLERVEPPAALWSAISARLGEAEIADSQRAPAARWWSRLVARVRPVLVPVGLTASACAIAIIVVQVRRSPAREPLPIVVPAMQEVARPSVRIALRDASDELADEQRRIDDKFRDTAADLLELARGEIAHASPGQARQFALEVARHEKAVLYAPAGRERERAWHVLTAYLETVAIGDRLALGGDR